ncbi:hypothetical protein OHB05_40305 [Streptomyces sp. NBC_00638]|uniref:hypothetical protein n=1 Tax=unclassified Streptomyces TaxID=2593676 RepID=UPI002255DC6D|nr:hypothetical protein [Streptomyces sp. NBC_00638]MCX5008769.1 hypothetical protein [Streptomyces sp. NBC_00638]
MITPASNEPPLWVYLLACLSSWPASSALLDASVFASAVGNSTVGEWAVRLAVTSTATAVLSFGVDKDRRGSDDDHTTDGPASPHRSAEPRPARSS